MQGGCSMLQGRRCNTGMDRRNRRFTMMRCEPEAVDAMANDQTQIDRIQQYIRQMTPKNS
jgi:hypothetical protein